jgi:hypothetical protein
MPLAISPDGTGWVRVPAKKSRGIRITRADQAAALKSPLAYFACTPTPVSKPKIPDCPVYTLDPNEHTPPSSERSPQRSSHGGNGRRSHARQQEGRSVSTPVHPYDEEFPTSDEEEDYHTTIGGAVRPPPPRSTISHERVRPRPAQASSPRPTPAMASAVKPRAVTTAAPGSGYTYWTGPSNKGRVPPRSAAWGSSSTASSSSSTSSARWANATAPLAL